MPYEKGASEFWTIQIFLHTKKIKDKKYLCQYAL